MDILEENLHRLLPSRHHILPYALGTRPTVDDTGGQAYPLPVPSEQAEDVLKCKLQRQPIDPKMPKLLGDRGVTEGER